ARAAAPALWGGRGLKLLVALPHAGVSSAAPVLWGGRGLKPPERGQLTTRKGGAAPALWGGRGLKLVQLGADLQATRSARPLERVRIETRAGAAYSIPARTAPVL